MDLWNPPGPRKYAEQVLGKAVTPEQLDELFRLHASAHPVVEHSIIRESREWHNLRCTTVVFLSHAPTTPSGGPPASVIASGQAICNPGDQWNRRLGVTIAFGRALATLRMEVEGVRHAVV